MSIFGLWTRRTWKRALAVFAGMAAAELGLFLWAARHSLDGSLKQIMEEGRFMIAVMPAFLLLTFFLINAGADRETKQSYTLGRLGVTLRRSFLLRASHNALWYLAFWGVQLAVVLGLCLIWRQMHPMLWSAQTLLLTFFRVSYLHALLPLGDWFIYIRNLLFFALMGCATAANVEKKTLYAYLGFSLTFGIYFPAKMGLTGTAIAELTVLLLLAGIAVICIINLKDEPGEEAARNGTKA
ncbi:MAG: hypothetical protein J5449_12490 [Oscillospiraceae bacterium]|nr:hypothetical protein [Oscillospiraceae bacterium]